MNMENTNGDTCATRIKRKPGGQPGNQNARIHGFYSKVLDEDERRDYEEARTYRAGEEIALMRAKIAGIMRHAPDNHKVLVLAMGMLCRLLTTHYHITKGDKKGMQSVVMDIMKTAAIPIGYGLDKLFDK
jgi:hypothetical protein